MGDAIVIMILAVVIGAALTYIIRAKRRGVKCIGCSAGCNCPCGGVTDNTTDCGCGCSNK